MRENLSKNEFEAKYLFHLMLIAIIYPKEDYKAANVALKVQALAQSKNQRVYVVPKTFW